MQQTVWENGLFVPPTDIMMPITIQKEKVMYHTIFHIHLL